MRRNVRFKIRKYSEIGWQCALNNNLTDRKIVSKENTPSSLIRNKVYIYIYIYKILQEDKNRN